jgi:hypothetical protein
LEKHWISQCDTGFNLRVRATPNSSKDEILGSKVRDDGLCYLMVKIRAIPDENSANHAIIALIAKSLGVAKSTITITAGAKSRAKTLLVKSLTLSIEAITEKLSPRSQNERNYN